MPRDEKTMPICGPKETPCIEEALEVVEKASHDPNGPVKQCDCLPACNDMTFPTQMSTSKMNKANLLKVNTKLKGEVPAITGDEFVKNNVAILHVYHDQLFFLRFERGQVFSIFKFFKYKIMNDIERYLFSPTALQ